MAGSMAAPWTANRSRCPAGTTYEVGCSSISNR